MAWTGVFGLLLIAWPPVECLLSSALENGYPRTRFELPAADEAVVVPSAGIREPRPFRPYPLPDHDTYARCDFAAWIFRTQRALPILVSGGAADSAQPPLARTMGRMLSRLGVPAEMIWTDEFSRNTFENALYSAAILRKHGIRRVALVVDGVSMRRAAACFRKQGIEVDPAPYDLREWGGLAEEILPTWQTIGRNEALLHETGGIVWYWLRDRI